MLTRIACLTVLSFVLMLVTDRVAHAAAEAAWPFPSKPAKVMKIDDKENVGLFNDRVGLLIRKSDAAVQGIWSPATGSLVDSNLNVGGRNRYLWSIELMPPGAEKPVLVEQTAAESTTFKIIDGEDGQPQVQIESRNARNGEHACDVIVTASIGGKDNDRIAWGIEVKMHGDSASVWTVNYPQLIIAAPDADPAKNQTIVPYRQGSVSPFGKGAPKYAQPYPYPGPSAKFQFTAAWGAESGRGLYYAVEDGESHDKIFLRENNPDRNVLVIGTQHLPPNRGIAGTGYQMPYRVVTAPFEGDWWHASRLYRDFWTQQTWARHGLMRDRADVPEWAKHSPIITRPSTTKPNRTVALNLAGGKALSAALGGRPFMGTWYGAFKNIGEEAGGGLDKEGHGHIRPLKPDVADALAELKTLGIHHIAYIQSIIYDPTVTVATLEADNAAADKAVARTRDGKPAYYGNEQMYSMDRSTDWWQQRIIAQAKLAMDAGFEGIYLDSFGKSSPECFDPSHGHPIGGGNSATAGQRAMAERLLGVIRKDTPQAILSGEAPTEAYRDLIHVNLYAVNIWGTYQPISRTIWGDYTLEHGRVIRPIENQDTQGIYSEMARLFVDGAIIGRIFTEGQSFLTQPQYAAEMAFLNRLARYTEHGIEHLRFGEYLHPLALPADLPTVSFTESVQNEKLTLPAIMHSVTRSHADGSVAITLVNMSDQPLNVAVPIDPALAGNKGAAALSRMDESGKLTSLQQGDKPWTQAVEIAPHDVAFLVLK